MSYGIIYEIKNMVNNKRYIGQTIRELNKRCNWTERSVLCIYHHNIHLLNSINKYDFKNFERKILDFANSQEELNEKEVYYIKKYSTLDSNFGYNLKHGGSNGKQTKEIREKQSKSLKNFYKKNPETNKGKNHPMYGKHHSKESRKQMSKIRKGKTWEDIFGKENAEKMKEEKKDSVKKMWENKEHRRKMSELRKGKTYEEIYGKEKGKELRKKRGETKKDKTWEERFGVERAKKLKKEMSIRKKQQIPWNKGMNKNEMEKYKNKIKKGV